MSQIRTAFAKETTLQYIVHFKSILIDASVPIFLMPVKIFKKSSFEII